MNIAFHGAVRTVTGSCILLFVNGIRVLVDCGLRQGIGADAANTAPYPFNPKELDYVLLTHAHLDHSGALPKLVKAGFSGKILATPATTELAGILLFDSAHIQETDAGWLTKKSFRAGKDIVHEPLYTAADVGKTLPLFEHVPYEKIIHLTKGVRFRFLDAGHILGSGTIEFRYQDGPAMKTAVFSGDIGKKNNPIIRDPSTVAEADIVVMESTYGDRLHKDMDESADELVEAIRTAFNRNGNVLIPSFAVGRTQDLIYTLHRLNREGRIPALTIYVDSPLAQEATNIYLSHPECFDAEAMRAFREHPGGGIRVVFTRSVEESQKINAVRSHAVIIAGSGMCEGGRIRHHFKHNLWRKECGIVFVGYQANGTLGRRIVDGAKIVSILGEEVAVRASVHTIGGFSAHADRDELLQWLGKISGSPEVFVVHGEEKASLAFAESVRDTLELSVQVPYQGDEFIR